MMKLSTVALTSYVLSLLFFVVVFNIGNTHSQEQENDLSFKDLDKTTDLMGIEVYLYNGNPFNGTANYINRRGRITGKMNFLDGRGQDLK
ncbi:hypothetical protein [Aestuariivivens sediminicola]|uniref:hypothetical protein n=1 Tax=Aestuariivivens sediminicola TaxID=2913560 RepID=UPI001F55BCE3|nr:hypothetical protein [Aestuariivivens sediminicola]